MINVGVVGCGYWGPKHIRSFHELAGAANLTTVCDVEEDRLRQVRTQYPHLVTVSKYKELLRDNVDAIVIATPVNSHYDLAKQALLHKKHVFVEKPGSRAR
jgi:predicted dehydrogenase